MLYHKEDSLLLRCNILKYKLSLYVVCVQHIFVESTLRSNYSWSQVSFPTLHPTGLLTYSLKMLHFHFLHSMYSHDVTRWILLVTSRNNRSIFLYLHVLLYDRKNSSFPSTQLTKPKVVSLTQPALRKPFNGMANHAGHIYMESAGSGIKHLGS